ncbi:MAG: hypothetical protein ACRCW0_08935 [Clostridium sp.]
MKGKKTSTSMTISNINVERRNRGIKKIRCVCEECLYYNNKRCKFGNITKERTHCIKFIKLEDYLNESNPKKHTKKRKKKKSNLY